jgi:hypothetical protein
MNSTPVYSRLSASISSVSGEYIWKYTHNGYDFNVFGTSPIISPPSNGAIPRLTGLCHSAEAYRNCTALSAFVVMSSVAARFYPPTVSGIAPPAPPGVFRIDHDEHYGQTFPRHSTNRLSVGPWLGFQLAV